MTTFRSVADFRSNLSCMFTCQGFNYDWIEANNGKPSHRLPQLELSPSGFESLPDSYKEALKAEAYKALRKMMVPSKSVLALEAKAERAALSLDIIEARDCANRPDTIPADMSAMQVDSWNEHDLPVGTVLGVLSTEAWRRGEVNSVSIHAPQPLPAYKVPQREITASERQVADWLAQPGRKVTTAKKPDRLASLMAKFWDTGDGSKWTQPIDPRNAELRAGRAAA